MPNVIGLFINLPGDLSMNKFLATVIAATGATLSFGLAGVTPVQAVSLRYDYDWVSDSPLSTSGDNIQSARFSVTGTFEYDSQAGDRPIVANGLNAPEFLQLLSFSVNALITDSSGTRAENILQGFAGQVPNIVETRSFDGNDPDTGESIPTLSVTTSLDRDLRFIFNPITPPQLIDTQVGEFRDGFQVGRGVPPNLTPSASNVLSSLLGPASQPISSIFLSNLFEGEFSNDGLANSGTFYLVAQTNENVYYQLGSSSNPPVAAVPEPTTVLGMLLAGAAGAALKKKASSRKA
jgi:hypothetical protein